MGFARLAEQSIRKARGKQEGEKLGALDRVFASSVGGALGCWNQPIEVCQMSRPMSCPCDVPKLTEDGTGDPC